MNYNGVNFENLQRILELYLCSNDNRICVIAELTSVQPYIVSNIIQDYFDGKIEFKRGNFKIFHSSINNF